MFYLCVAGFKLVTHNAQIKELKLIKQRFYVITLVYVFLYEATFLLKTKVRNTLKAEFLNHSTALADNEKKSTKYIKSP